MQLIGISATAGLALSLAACTGTLAGDCCPTGSHAYGSPGYAAPVYFPPPAPYQPPLLRSALFSYGMDREPTRTVVEKHYVERHYIVVPRQPGSILGPQRRSWAD